MYRISVKEGKEKQLIKHHPWVFSGAIDKVSPPFENGDWAEITSSSGSFIAYGWYDEKSHILLHLLSWDRSQKVGNDLIRSLVKESILRRRPYFSSPDTTSFRIIHGEADFLPGIAADVYANQIRVIISSRFAEHFLPEIVSELTSTLKPLLIQVTADPQYAPQEGISEKARYFRDGEEIKESDADLKNVQFIESGIYYEATPGKGQKSGFYCDQRNNRNIVEGYASEKTVLDVCSFTGAFTLHCLRGNAKSVDAVDASETALRHLLYQVHINEDRNAIPKGSRERVTITNADAFDYIRTIEQDKYDMIILDPPKLAKTKSKLENAQKAYKDLNRVAMSKIKNGGIIATFSCSGAMTREMFKLTLSWAAADAKVEIQILETLSAGDDHPVRLSSPESEYLKGYILRVIK